MHEHIKDEDEATSETAKRQEMFVRFTCICFYVQWLLDPACSFSCVCGRVCGWCVASPPWSQSVARRCTGAVVVVEIVWWC